MKNTRRLLFIALALLCGCGEIPTQAPTEASTPDLSKSPAKVPAEAPSAGEAKVPAGISTPAPAQASPPAAGRPMSRPAPTQAAVAALFRSIENDDFPGFSRLVDAGVHVGATNKLGETPLYFAAEKGRLEMAKILIAKGADARALTPSGETVLHAAAMIESSALTTALVQAGAEVDRANSDGETPLYWAAMTGTFLAVKALADAGANLNLQDRRRGNTALHAAAWHNDIVLVHYLLSKGARTDIRNDAGLTAFEFAKAGGRASAIRLLEP
jgi:ankyrin repeat protein